MAAGAMVDIPRSWALGSLAALIAIAVAPAWLCVGLGGSWRHLLAGGVVWWLSVGAKRVVVQAARAPLGRLSTSVVARAVRQGIVSAATELGAAAIYLAYVRPDTWLDAVTFGVGAGAAEVVYVIVLGVIWPQTDAEVLAAWKRGADISWCVRYAVPIERLFALIGHTGSRGLLYLAILVGGAAGVGWAACAVLLFSAIDGVAVYGHFENWQWHEPAVCRRAHSFFAALSLSEAALLLLGWQHSM